MTDAGAAGGGKGCSGEGEAAASHFLIDAVPESDRSSALDTCNAIKISRAAGAPSPPGDDAVRTLERVAVAYELAAIDQWPGPAAGGDGGENFRRTCAECFALIEACPIPADPVQMVGHVLRAVSYAYMGERREDARRYARETAPPPPADGADQPGGWERRLLFGIYGAVMLAVGEEGPEDLARASEAIAGLRRDQAGHERPYFESLEPAVQAAAAHRLVSLYHLAKCTYMVCEYMRNGSPADIEALLDYHFDKALRHIDAGAGSAELDTLLRIVRPMFTKMVGG